MDQLDSGEKLIIDSDCTQATETIPRWAADEGHDVADYRGEKLIAQCRCEPE
ncbi:hypothetical protein CIP107534_01741 [Corynebacterium diphtheriae]|nr:hypothetical protein CIP107521_01887 [Corynebacterium diphtheriae]CAB0573346.1 hypothetical protein CIP107534_01741 [Corynebacterium diphtheriae]